MRTPVSGGWSNPYRLVAKNLSYKLCQKESSKFILKDVNCEAKPGEITAIAGPSGAGKTTLLEILAGQITPSRFSGQVLPELCDYFYKCKFIVYMLTILLVLLT